MPAGIHALAREWLTQALCDGVPGAEVVDGTSSRRTMTRHLQRRRRRARRRLFTKCAPTFLTRMVGAGANLAQIEATFYAQVRPTLDIEAPATQHSAYDPVSHRQMLITDDVERTRGATFGSAPDRTLTHEQAGQVVTTLATLHRAFWNRPLVRMFGTWLRSAEANLAGIGVAIGAEACHGDVHPGNWYVTGDGRLGSTTDR